eukprot:2189976-Pyramimonas_sp.AAC.1
MKVLVTGGSGYLGQFIVSHLASKGVAHRVAYTYSSNDASVSSAGMHVTAHRVDLKTGEGLNECVKALGT